MAKSHGKKTVVFVNGTDLGVNSNNSQKELSADMHDVTTYGKNSHVFFSGLRNGTATVSGFYDTTAGTGPRDLLTAIWQSGAACLFVHRPEGTGSGLPQDSVQAFVSKYTETLPVADMVTWSCDFQFSDDINQARQP